jgi:hypothetical protein
MAKSIDSRSDDDRAQIEHGRPGALLALVIVMVSSSEKHLSTYYFRLNGAAVDFVTRREWISPSIHALLR